MTSSAPRIANTALQESFDDVLMQVDRERVLKVRAVFLREADELEKAMRDATRVGSSRSLPGRMGSPGQGVWVGRCSDDPISGPAQISFNREIHTLLQPCWQYVADLRLGAEQLGEAARRYGYTEDEIRDSFRSER